jgi:hypothetical protein
MASTVRTRTKTEVLTDKVRKSPVDEHNLRFRRRTVIVLILILILLGAIKFVWRFAEDKPKDYASIAEHFKYGSINSSRTGGEPIDQIGTPPYRLNSYTYTFSVNQYTLYPDSRYRFKPFCKIAGYANQPLDAIWARAPYVHNGSVPTLRYLTEPPEQRPRVVLPGRRFVRPEKGGLRIQCGQSQWAPFHHVRYLTSWQSPWRPCVRNTLDTGTEGRFDRVYEDALNDSVKSPNNADTSWGTATD